MSQLVSLDLPLHTHYDIDSMTEFEVFCWLEVDFKEYNKITGSVEEKVNSTSTDKKALLQPALASLIDTIKRQPDIFSNLLRMSTGAGAPV